MPLGSFADPSGPQLPSNNATALQNDSEDDYFPPGEGVHMAVHQSAGKIIGLAWYDTNTGEVRRQIYLL